MIDHERRFVFVHIPKTAGMSVYRALGVDRGFGHLRLEDHPGYSSEYFSFAFVRNPWDRLVSTYAYLREGGRGNAFDLAARAVIADCDTFERFARDIARYRDGLARIRAPGWGVPLSDGNDGPQGREAHRYPHLLPQTTWTHLDGRQILDFVGGFESLDQDLDVVRAAIGPIGELARVNASDRGHYRDYYSRRSRRAIAREYSADIERFGYSF